MKKILLLALTVAFTACTTGGDYSRNDCGCKPKKECCKPKKEKVCGCETCDK